MMAKDWPTRTERAMLHQQISRLRPPDAPATAAQLGRQHLSRDAHRAVEGARRPGWIRRHGWLSH